MEDIENTFGLLMHGLNSISEDDPAKRVLEAIMMHGLSRIAGECKEFLIERQNAGVANNN